MKGRDRGRDKERSRTTPREVSPRPRRRKETRSNRGPSNNAMGRMDKKYGSGTEKGRRSSHPTHQEVDKERKKDRSSRGERVKERREGMGQRRGNDNLEKSNLCAKRLSPMRRHHLNPPQRKDHRTSWTIQNPGIDHQKLLVAVHSVGRPMIRRRMSTVSTSKNEKREDPCTLTAKHHPRTAMGTYHC